MTESQKDDIPEAKSGNRGTQRFRVNAENIPYIIFGLSCSGWPIKLLFARKAEMIILSLLLINDLAMRVGMPISTYERDYDIRMEQIA